MLLLARASQSELIALAEATGLSAAVGPTSEALWTAVWFSDEDELDDRFPHGIRISEDAVVVLWSERGIETWFPGDDAEVVARLLAARFGVAERATDVAAALEGATDLDELLEGLGGVVELPTLDVREADRAVLLHSGDRATLLTCASVVCSSYVAEIDRLWTAVVPVDAPAEWIGAGTSKALGRKRRVLQLSRAGDSSSLVVWRHGKPVAGWTWRSEWLFSHAAARDLDDETNTLRQLLALVDTDIDRVELRRVLRDHGVPGDPLQALVAVLRLPVKTLAPIDEVDSRGYPSDARFVRQVSVRKAVVKAMNTGVDSASNEGLRLELAVFLVWPLLLVGGLVWVALNDGDDVWWLVLIVAIVYNLRLAMVRLREIALRRSQAGED